MVKKEKIETPPSMLGIMEFNVDTSRLRLSPQLVLAIAVGVALVVILLNYTMPLR
ncbi:MAG: preprotein translocase subunit Sec61beta [Candidatus Diapherotrites archaeon]|nr:preprotein translocase subunit Sec61beta [Candidatus Diapherotrites archaeon]